MPDEQQGQLSRQQENFLGVDSVANAMLARGEMLLGKLEKEAEAARAEARRAQLHVALADARSGTTDALQAWLLRYDAGHAESESPPTPHFPDTATQSGLDASHRGLQTPQAPEYSRSLGDRQAPEHAALLGNWESLLPAARERLQARIERLRSSGTSSPGSKIPTPTAPIPASSLPRSLQSASPKSDAAERPIRERPVEAKGKNRLTQPAFGPQESQEKRRRKRRASSSREGAKRNAPTQATRIPAGKQARQKPSPELLKAIHAGEEEQPNGRKPVLWRLGGAGASLIAHVLIIIVLGLITFKLPAPPASLVFESSAASASQPDFAMVEPVESTELEEPAEAMPHVENRVDLSSNVDALNARMAESLAQAMASSPQGPVGKAASAAFAGTGSGMSQAAASFFGAEASGNCFCFVIDSSSSMRGGPWEAAKVELFRSLSSFKSNQRFYIIFFNKKVDAIPEVGEREPAKFALYATPENLSHAKQWTDTIRISAGAPPAKALEFAISLDPDAIYLLTDGVTKTDLPGFLREHNRVNDVIDGEKVKVPIHAIAFYSLDGQALMQQVASENAGQFIYVPDPTDRN